MTPLESEMYLNLFKKKFMSNGKWQQNISN